MITLILNMRTHNLTKIFNSLLLLSALSLIAMSFQKIFLSKNQHNQSLLEIIGEIGEYQNDVRLKRSQDLAWSFVRKNKLPLGINDSVFTNAQSEVDLILEDQQELKLKSESLIRIKKRDEILLQSGEVEITLKENARPLALNIGNVIYQLKGEGNAKLKITNTDSQKVVEVQTGSVEIQKEDQKIKINSGEKVEIEQAKLTATSAQIELTYPQGVIILKRGERLKPTYNSNLVVEKALLIRADKTFELNPGEDISLRGDDYQYTLKMRNKNIKAPLVDFKLIKEIEAPRLYLPIDQFNLETIEDKSQVDFKFSESRQKEIQIFDDSQTLIHSDLINGNSWSYQFPIGIYKWRIKYFEDYTQSPFSEFRSFSIGKIDINNLKAIKIELTKPNQLVEFNWNNGSQKEVIFKLSRSPDFSGEVLEKKVIGSKTKITIPEIGTYYWTVKDKNGLKRPVKVLITPTPAPTRAPKVKNLNFEYEIPTNKSSLFNKIINFIFPRAYAQDDTKALFINIEKIDEAKIYEIEIYDQEDNLLFQKQSAKPTFKWAPKTPGKFRYRVRFQDFWRRWSPFSEIALIKVRTKYTNEKNSKRKDKKKTQSMAEKVISKKLKKSEKKKDFKLLGNYVFYSMRNLDAQQDGDNNFEIEGLSTTGHALSFIFQNPYAWGEQFVLHYQSQYGSVFDGEEYNQRDLNLGSTFHYANFYLTPQFGLHQHSIYELSGSDVKLAGLELTYSLGLTTTYPINYGTRSSLSPYLKFTTLGLSTMRLGVSYEYRYKKQFSLLIDGAHENKNYSGLSEVVESQSIHILSGIRYDY